MIKISPSGWIAIAACACVLSWTKGANLSGQASCNLTSKQETKFKELAKKKASLKKFKDELGNPCTLGLKKRHIFFYEGNTGILSAQFHTKTKKVIKVKYVKKTNKGNQKETD